MPGTACQEAIHADPPIRSRSPTDAYRWSPTLPHSIAR